MPTLADSIAEAARLTPQRAVLVDGDVRLDCESLYAQASTLARSPTSTSCCSKLGARSLSGVNRCTFSVTLGMGPLWPMQVWLPTVLQR